MATDERRLRDVFIELATTVNKVGGRPTTGRRRTRKKAEIAIVLRLYAEILVILERLVAELAWLEAFMAWQRETVTPGGAAAAQTNQATWEQHFSNMERIRVDILSLYHWAYAVEDALRQFGMAGELSELERLSIFRSKLLVHPATTALHRARDIAAAGTLVDSTGEDIRILSHPFTGRNLLQGHRGPLRRLEAMVPGLKDEKNAFEKIDLIYRHYGRITDPKLKGWARNTLFDRTGLKSDPPRVIAAALLDAFKAFRRERRF